MAALSELALEPDAALYIRSFVSMRIALFLIIRERSLPKAVPAHFKRYQISSRRSSFANDCEKGPNDCVKGPKGRNNHIEIIRNIYTPGPLFNRFIFA